QPVTASDPARMGRREGSRRAPEKILHSPGKAGPAMQRCEAKVDRFWSKPLERLAPGRGLGAAPRKQAEKQQARGPRTRSLLTRWAKGLVLVVGLGFTSVQLFFLVHPRPPEPPERKAEFKNVTIEPRVTLADLRERLNKTPAEYHKKFVEKLD